MKTFLSFFLLSIFFITSCSKDETITEPTREYNERESGNFTFNNSKAIVIENQTGPLIIEGSADTMNIGWFLDKHVFAASYKNANDIFEKIIVSQIELSDTLYISVKIPPAANSANTSLSLTLPNSIPCIIRNVDGVSIINYIQANIECKILSDLSITGHDGNCTIDGSGENVNVEMALPENGFCLINIEVGNINLRLPSSTSAMLLAQTNDGAIFSSGLSISDSVRIPTRLSGKLGNGSGQINLSTGKGNISIVGF
ncbi:MAG: DUF4097 family beta strand repeat protein [Ignavibacteriae bacterium]|nr:hypothetical protein [Ignavibacteriota bacterium]NOH00281.1 DUF4097 family beta strand repeat protein [Ignavibacteriota bacterium]